MKLFPTKLEIAISGGMPAAEELDQANKK